MAGDPVCTRDGRKVKILDFNFNGGILIKVKADGEDLSYETGKNGSMNEITGSKEESDLDLFMADRVGYMNAYIVDKTPVGSTIYPTFGDCDIELLQPDKAGLKFFRKCKVIFLDE